MMLLSSPVWAKEAGEDAAPAKGEPIRISSDLMETANRSNLVIFRGNVVVVRGDLTIKSDELQIYNSEGLGKIEKMIARGNVWLKYKGRVASAEKAIYYNTEEKIELVGKPKVEEGGNQISGEVMLLFLREDRSVVKGDGEVRVNVVYYPAEKEERAAPGADR
jgi:lipopolysaccharide export system protein LptA